ncbi:hypothetical protein RSA46_04750 [Pseudomonas oryzihabitans]|nr:hypothetical protein SB5_03860 [Pseudomonas psychrotolerans]KTT46071.1 hypothetical protein RSA46_04750 [Pseudomonas psychrotolerans]
MESKFIGCVDTSATKRIEGWAYDRSAPLERVRVLAVQSGKVLAATVANKFRADLKSILDSDGCQGFSLELPSLKSFEPISVLVQDSQYELTNSPVIANLEDALTCMQDSGLYELSGSDVLPEELRKITTIRNSYAQLLGRLPSAEEAKNAIAFLVEKSVFELVLSILYSEEFLSRKRDFGKLPQALVSLALAADGLTANWERLLYCLSRTANLGDSQQLSQLLQDWATAPVLGCFTLNEANDVVGWAIDVRNPYLAVSLSLEFGGEIRHTETAGAPYSLAFHFPQLAGASPSKLPAIVANGCPLQFLKTTITPFELLLKKVTLYHTVMWDALIRSNASAVLRQDSILSLQGDGSHSYISKYMEHVYHERFGKAANVQSLKGRSELVSWYVNEFREQWQGNTVFPVSAGFAEHMQEGCFNDEVTELFVSRLLFLFWKKHEVEKDSLFSRLKYMHLLYRLVSSPNAGSVAFLRLCGERLIQPLQARHPDSSRLPFDINWYWRIALAEELQEVGTGEFSAARYVEFTFNKVFFCCASGFHVDLLPAAWLDYWRDDIGDGLGRAELVMAKALLGYEPRLEVAKQWLAEVLYRRYPQLQILKPVESDERTGRLSGRMRALIEGVRQIENKVFVVGHTSQTGLGANLRMTVEALKGINIRPAIVSVDKGELELGEEQCREATDVERPVIIFHVNADRIPYECSRLPADLLEKAHKIGFFLWETSSPPASHRLGLELMDEVWVPTTYLQDIYSRITTTPIVNVRKGISLPTSFEAFERKDIGLSDEDFVFLSIGDFHSSIPRKNPLSVVQAFKAAFSSGENVKLVLKIRNVDFDHWCNQGGYWNRVLEAIGGDERITILDHDLSASHYWGLMDSCDAFVSLHKSEGFGYGIAHAMLLGKPTIVSDYSGSKDFCSDATSFLVEVEEVLVEESEMPSVVAGAVWGMPSVDAAAIQMRRVYQDSGEAQRRATNSLEFMSTNYSLAALSRMYASRLGL